MTVHIFGATSSPNCAKFGLKQLAKDYGNLSSAAQSFIQRDFYVDDGLTSCETVEEAISLLQDTRTICSQGQLKLHKLLSSHREVLKGFPSDDWAISEVNFANDDHVERALGLKWNVHSDMFLFSFNPKESSLSRRGLLSNCQAVNLSLTPLGSSHRLFYMEDRLCSLRLVTWIGMMNYHHRLLKSG